MDWYIVIKTINGHRYYYRQKTWREGKHVRTRSEYVGPVGSAEMGPAALRKPTATAAQHESIEISKETTEDAYKLVSGAVAENWDHAWRASRGSISVVTRHQKVDGVVKALNVKWKHGMDGAFYRPATDEVNIPPERCFFDKDGQSATSAYYIVMFHELVHWTKARGRLNRRGSTSRREYAREELVAELGAVMLMKHFGIEIGNEGRHALYFQVWLGRTGDQDDAIKHARHEAARAVKFIINRGIISHG